MRTQDSETLCHITAFLDMYHLKIYVYDNIRYVSYDDFFIINYTIENIIIRLENAIKL